MSSSADVGYAGTPLPRKLGIKVGSRVLLDGAPDGFDLGPLPEQVVVHARPGSSPYDVGLLFCPDLARAATTMAPAARHDHAGGRLWVAWPKRVSGLATDLDEQLVRVHGLARGRPVSRSQRSGPVTKSGSCRPAR